MKRIFLSATVFLVCSVLPLSAHNNLFLPGDAFFMTEISIEELEELRDNNKTTLPLFYSRYPGFGFFCGYLGYRHAQINEVPPRVFQQIIDACNNMPADTHETLETESGEEIKKLTAYLFIIAILTSERLRIGIDYNEDWATIQRKHRGKHVMYPGRGNESTIIENWRNSTEVNPCGLHRDQGICRKGNGRRRSPATRLEKPANYHPYRHRCGYIH